MRSAAGGPVVVTLWRVRTQSSRCLLRTHVWLAEAVVHLLKEEDQEGRGRLREGMERELGEGR